MIIYNHEEAKRMYIITLSLLLYLFGRAVCFVFKNFDKFI